MNQNEFASLDLGAETLNKIETAGQRCALRQAAADENTAAVKANALGLSGRAADDFKSRYVAAIQESRSAVRLHVKAVLESPEGKARPAAAQAVAMRPDLTTEQAIEHLAALPAEHDETEAAAAFILGAGR